MTLRAALLCVALLSGAARAESVAPTVNLGPPQVWTADTAFLFLNSKIDQNDKRYEQRALDADRAVAAALQAAKDAVAAALQASKEAVSKAEAANEKRLDNLNELRGIVVDQSSKFMTKSEIEARLNAMNDKLSDMLKRLDTLDAKASGAAGTWYLVVGGLGLLIGIGGLVLNIRRQDIAGVGRKPGGGA